MKENWKNLVKLLVILAGIVFLFWLLALMVELGES